MVQWQRVRCGLSLVRLLGAQWRRFVIHDRFNAIRVAIATAQERDVVIIAGKGNEDFQEYHDENGQIVRVSHPLAQCRYRGWCQCAAIYLPHCRFNHGCGNGCRRHLTYSVQLLVPC